MSPDPTALAAQPIDIRSPVSLRAVFASAVARIEWRAFRPLIAVTVLIHGITALILLANGLPVGYAPSGLVDMIFLFCVGAVITPGYILAPQIASDMIRQLRGRKPTPIHERLTHFATLMITGLVLALIFAVILLTNSNLKPAIPVLNPQTYDIQLETFERALCGGVLPSQWLITHSSRLGLRFWDFIYDLFGTFLFVSMMIALHREGTRGGARLVLGLAIGLFSSVLIALLYPTLGPLFVHPEWFTALDGTETAQLAAYLTRTAQHYADAPGVRHAVAGIAAMPSYHVVSWTCGLACWRHLPRPLFAFGCLLVLLNWISTVVLGWHYALDGAAGVGLALVACQLARWILPRANSDTSVNATNHQAAEGIG